VDLGRLTGERRSARDRRGGRILRLLTEIGKTLVTLQPLTQVLARVVDLVFDAVPVDRRYLLGDVVNTASRLESSVAQPNQIVITDKTRERIGDAFEVRPLGVVTLRGRGSDLAAFEVIG
jgi:hypothetical protein